ncbi:MAG TPA: thioredoxin family protein [Candidatus Cloacimonadota bacterium]|nr:thioredoxin family protein [Candidatus Cloacimonadota bacterium]
MIIHLNEDNLELLESTEPKVLVFFAQWCRPCSSYHPSLESVSQKYPSVQIIKIDVDEFPKLADRYNISSVPSSLFLRNGVLKEMLVGVLTEPILNTKLDQLIQ